MNHKAKFFLDGYATPSQLAGTLLNVRLLCKLSIASVILRAPVKPNFKSSNVLLIYPKRPFILSHSCKHTTTNGVFYLTLKLIYNILKPSGALVLKSLIKFITKSSLEPPPPPDPPAVIDKIVSKRV